MGQFTNERRIPMGMLWTFYVVAVDFFVFVAVSDAASSNSKFTFITASSFVSITAPSTSTSAQSSSNLNAIETTTGGISTTSRTLSTFASTASTASQAPSSTSSLVSPDTAILSISRTNTLNQTLHTSASLTIKSGVVDTRSFSYASLSDSSALFNYNSSSIVVGETRMSHVSSPSSQSSVSRGSLSILPSYSSKSVNDDTTIYVSSTGLPSQSLVQLETSHTVLSSSDVLVTSSSLSSSNSPGTLKTRLISTSPVQVTSSIMGAPSSEVLQENQTMSVVITSGLPSSNLTSTLLTTPSFIGSSSLDTVTGSSIIYNITESSRTLTRSATMSLSLVGTQNATSQSSRTVPLDTSSKASFLSTAAIGVVSSSTVPNGTSTSVAVLSSSLMSQNITSQPSLSSKSELFAYSSEPATSLSSVSNAGVLSSTTMTTVKMSSSKLLASSSLMVSPIIVTSQSTLLSELTLSSKATSSSSQIAQPSSFSPNKTSTYDGFIVTSYSTPCYIYYVVEKTILPVMTVNHTAIPATTPQVTLDIGSVSSVLPELPTVTLTQPITMTTKESEMQSQLAVTSDVLGSSTRSAEVPSSTNIVPSLVSLRSGVKPTLTSSQPSISLSESVTVALVSSQQQTGTIFIPIVSSSAIEMQSASTANGTLGFSHMASSSRFSPRVATPSISNKQNLSLATATSTLSSVVSHIGASSTSLSGLAQVDASSSLLLTGSGVFTTSTVGLQSRVSAASSIPHSSNSSSTSKMVVAPSPSATPSTSGQLASLSRSSYGTNSQTGATSSPFTSLVSHTDYTLSQVALTSSLAHTADTSSAINIAPSSSSAPLSSTVELFTRPAERRREKRAVEASNSNMSMTATHSLNSGAPQPSYIHTASATTTRSVIRTADSPSLQSSSGISTSSETKRSRSLMQTSSVSESAGFTPSLWLSSSGQISSEVLSSQSSSLIPSSSEQPLASSTQQQTSMTQTAASLSSVHVGASSSVSGKTVTTASQSASRSNHSVTPGVGSHGSTTTQIPSSVPMSASVPRVGTVLLSSLSTASQTQSSDAVKDGATSITQTAASLSSVHVGASSSVSGKTVTTASQSASRSNHSVTPGVGSHGSTTTQIPSSVPMSASVPRVGTVLLSSLSTASQTQSSDAVKGGTTSITQTAASLSSVHVGASSSVSGKTVTTASQSASRSNHSATRGAGSHGSTTMQIPSSVPMSASVPRVGTVLLSSLSTASQTQSSDAVKDGATSVAVSPTKVVGTLYLTVSLPSSEQTSSASLPFTSAVDNKPRYSTVLGTSSVARAKSLLGSSSEHISSFSPVIVSLRSSTLSSFFEVIIPSVSSSSLRRDLSTQEAPLPSAVFPTPSFLTKSVGSSLSANGSLESVTLHGSIVSVSGLPSSRTTDRSSRTLQQTFSSSLIIQRPISTIQSEVHVQPTAFSSSLTSLSSSFGYRPPLVTISSLGICYVVYTTRLVQATLVSTPQLNMSSTVSVSSTRTVSVFSMPLLPSVSLNASSVALQPTHTVTNPGGLPGMQSFTVKSTGRGSSSIIAVLSVTVSTINSRTSNPSSQVNASRSISSSISFSRSFRGASLLPTSTSVLPLQTSTSVLASLSSSTTEVSSSLEVPSSQSVSPTGTVSQAVSSSVPLPPTPPHPPDPMLLLQTTLTVPQNTDIQSLQFQNDLEAKLSEAYLFAEVTGKRRKRNFMVTTIVQSIQRLNGSDVHVIFYVVKSGQGVPASQAAENYNKLSEKQLSQLLKLDVVSMPEPLVKPTTSPILTSYLVSLIIQNSAGSNISSAVNKKKLELKLASYYQEKQQLPVSTNVSATIHTILHEPDERTYLEFYILVDEKGVNRTIVVEAFKVLHVNLLTAKLGVQVLVPVYIPETLTATELDHVIIGLSVIQNQDLENTVFRSELANKLATLYEEAKGRKAARRRRRSGSTSATIVDVVRNSNTAVSEVDVTFFMMDSGTVANASYVASVMNRLTTNEMTTFTVPYAVLTAPRPLVVPTSPAVVPTSATPAIKWWIIPAVIGPIFLIIVIILLVYRRWKKGAPKPKNEPDSMRMLETNRRRARPVHGFDVARYTESDVSGIRTTAFTSAREEEEEIEKSTRRGRETSLRRKVGKPPPQKEPIREAVSLKNPAYQGEDDDEEEEEDDESVTSVTPTGSTVGLLRSKDATKPPPATKRTPARPQRPQEPQVTQQVQGRQELSEDESEEESEVSEEESETEAESVAPPEQMKHSAAQLPTVAVMSEASGPPRYPPVRFRSSVHPAPNLPPIDAKKTSLVGAKAEPPSDGDSGRRKGKVTNRELEQRADLERQKNKQRLRDRKRDSTRSSLPPERRAWDRAQHDFDDVLAEKAAAERVITGKPGKRRRRRPPSSPVATDEEGMPHLKSYRKLKGPKTTSSTTSTRDHGKKRAKSAESASNVSSDESEIDMNETRRRMHAMLEDAFALFGPHSKKPTVEPEGQSPQPDEYPAPVPRPAIFPRYVGGHPALPEPPPAHGRATEPTPGQRRRVQPTMPGYPAAMLQTPIGVPGYPGRPPVRPVLTRDPIVVWDPADRQRILNQHAPPPTYAYRDPSGQNLYITPVHQQRDDMGGLVWSPYAAEDSMDVLYPDLAQASYPGALGTSPPKDASFLSQLQGVQPHDTILNASPNGTLDQRGASLGQSPQPLIKSIKDELFRLSQGATRKTPITEL